MPVVVDSAVQMRRPIRIVLADGRTMRLREPYVRDDTLFDRALIACGLEGLRCSRETAVSEIESLSVKTQATVRSAVFALVAIPAVYVFIGCVPQRCMD